MEIKVSGRKTTVTDALRAHVDEKIGEALKVFDIEPMTADVVLRYEKNPSNPRHRRGHGPRPWFGDPRGRARCGHVCRD